MCFFFLACYSFEYINQLFPFSPFPFSNRALSSFLAFYTLVTFKFVPCNAASILCTLQTV